MAAFQPNVLVMNALSQFHLAATINTGGAANDVRVPPMEIFTKSTPSARYLIFWGKPRTNSSGRRARAATVMAAGSVMKEPSKGRTDRHTQTLARWPGMGSNRESTTTRLRATCWIGREAATTITTNTNSGSVYWRLST